jgi:hypothetical protein
MVKVQIGVAIPKTRTTTDGSHPTETIQGQVHSAMEEEGDHQEEVRSEEVHSEEDHQEEVHQEEVHQEAARQAEVQEDHPTPTEMMSTLHAEGIHHPGQGPHCLRREEAFSVHTLSGKMMTTTNANVEAGTQLSSDPVRRSCLHRRHQALTESPPPSKVS